MYIVIPYQIDPEQDVIETSVPDDPEYPQWNSLDTYQQNQIVTTGQDEFKKYWKARYGEVYPKDPESNLPVLNNTNIDPRKTNRVGYDNDGNLIPNAMEYQHFGEPWWDDVSTDKSIFNKYKMFNISPTLVTITDGYIEFKLKTSEKISAIAIFNINADFVSVEVVNGPAYNKTKNIRYQKVLTEAFQNYPQLSFLDLPEIDPIQYPNFYLHVRIGCTENQRTIFVGSFIVGEKIKIGRNIYDLETELMDFSRFERDTWGNINVIRRGYSDRVKFNYVTEVTEQVRQLLISRRATLTVFIGHGDYPITHVLGYYVDITTPYQEGEVDFCNITVESVLMDSVYYLASIKKVVFIDRVGNNCIQSHLGPVAKICLENNQVTKKVTATVIDNDFFEDDQIQWELQWVSGTGHNGFDTEVIVTTCNQRLPLFIWPNTIPIQHGVATAQIKASKLRNNQIVYTYSPATLVIDQCGGGTGVELPKYGWLEPRGLTVLPESFDDALNGYWPICSKEQTNIIELSGKAGFKQCILLEAYRDVNSALYLRMVAKTGDVVAKLFKKFPLTNQNLIGILDSVGDEIYYGPDNVFKIKIILVEANSDFTVKLTD